MTARLEIAPRPPFRLDLTTWALRRRPDNAIDRWDAHLLLDSLAQAGLVAAPEATPMG